MKTLFGTVSVLGLFIVLGSAGGSDIGTLGVSGAFTRAIIGICLFFAGIVCTKYCGKICCILGIRRKRRTQIRSRVNTKPRALSAPSTKDIIACNTKLV